MALSNQTRSIVSELSQMSDLTMWPPAFTIAAFQLTMPDMADAHFPLDPNAPTWWQDAPALHRFVTDLLATELALARPGRLPAPVPWPDACHFAGDLGAD